MQELDCPPDAPSLMESMRHVGYSVEAALADLVDNSLSAHAANIDIQFRPFDDPHVAIIDDGDGMSPAGITAAMRHGSRSPLEKRAAEDLGRFGLGLKTASLSQCRRLTVASLHEGELSARCWDMDVVTDRGSWALLAFEDDEARRLPHVERLLQAGRGTLVLWQGLDRMLAGESDPARALGEHMDCAREHLATVFHRYIGGEGGHPKVRIAINDVPLQAIDPFLESHRATQPLDEDTFTVEGQRVTVKPFILPHVSKLRPDEIRIAGGQDGLRSQQGFYVYRNRRLIIWGTWFRLARKEELSKLARVRVDIPNALDHLWSVDIRKAIAAPPEVVRRNLRRTVDRIAERSRQTYTFRGRITGRTGVRQGWSRVETRDGVRYDIDRSHPAVEALRGRLGPDDARLLEALLGVLEASLPVDALYADMAADRRVADEPAHEEAALRQAAQTIADSLAASGTARRAFLDGLHAIEPFSRHPDLARRIAREIEDAVH